MWVLKGLGNQPAVMAVVSGHLWVITEDTTVVDTELAAAQVKFPKTQFDGGCSIEVNGERTRVSFVRPNGAADVPASLVARMDGVVAGAGLLGAARKVSDIREGRKLGKEWKAVLLA
ncbi:MAG: hypothetical protein FGM58_05010 [Acidimicrobiia bacterium]|nr:hypothetical protein [Acidimicrobiia bacterium]